MIAFTDKQQDFLDTARVYDVEVILPEGNLAHPHMFKGLMDLVDEWYINYLVEGDPSDEAVEIVMYLNAETSAYEALLVGNVLPILFRPDHWDFNQEADGSKRLCVRMIVND